MDFTVTDGANQVHYKVCHNMCYNVCYNVFIDNTWYCFLGVQNPITACIPTPPSAQISLAGLKY